MDWKKEIKVMIFDLDGTLYQDYTFLKRYLMKMFATTHTVAEIEQIVQESYDLLTGEKEVKLGFFYDEHLNFLAHRHLQITSAYNKKQELIDNYQKYDELTYIGDPWSIATYMAKREALDMNVVSRAFNEVRSEMLTIENKINANDTLVECLQQMDCYKILMTNTALPSGEEFVSHLGLSNCFDEIHYDGQKPNGMHDLLKTLIKKGYHPEQMISIGDHPYNDLHPLHALGGFTCLISQYPHADETEWSEEVNSIEELVLFLQTFLKTTDKELEVVKGG